MRPNITVVVWKNLSQAKLEHVIVKAQTMKKKCLISINWYTGWTVMDCPSTVPTHTSYHHWLTDHFRNYLSIYPSKRVLRVLLIPVCVTHCKYDTSHPSPRSPHEFLERNSTRCTLLEVCTQAHLGGLHAGIPSGDWALHVGTEFLVRRHDNDGHVAPGMVIVVLLLVEEILGCRKPCKY